MVGQLLWYLQISKCSWPESVLSRMSMSCASLWDLYPEPLSPQLHDNLGPDTTTTEERRLRTRELWTLPTLSEAAGVWFWIMKTDYPPTAACRRVMHCDQTQCSRCDVPRATCHVTRVSILIAQTWSGAGNNLSKFSFSILESEAKQWAREFACKVLMSPSTEWGFSITIYIM